MDYKKLLKRPEYEFLKTHPRLGKNIILLGMGGSISYGTNNENSDIDIRGIILNQKSDLIGMTSYEQYIDEATDTVIYSFGKMIQLLMACNPNTVELLGLRPDHYLYVSSVGQEILDNRKMFLSKRVIQSFGGYADAQLRRLQNALARDNYPQQEKEKHIYNSVKNALYGIRKRYASFENGSLKLYMDKAINPELETEIFMDVNLSHYPLRDYKSLWMELHNVVKDYEKLGKRNRKKDDNHLNKHAMHLIRLFMMAIDILEKGEINTYREKEQKILIEIRNGGFQKEDGSFKSEFFDLVSDYEKRLHDAAKHTDLPEEPDKKRIEEFVMSVNERVVKDGIPY